MKDHDCDHQELRRINLDEPYYDTTTFFGRLRHHFALLNPLNTFRSKYSLNESQEIVQSYKNGGWVNVSSRKLWESKYRVDAAFHPETEQRVHFLGRLSSHIVVNALITAAMLTYYKTLQNLVLWQWMNQSYNALYVYCNRPVRSAITDESSEKSYFASTLVSIGTVIALKRFSMRPKSMPYICKRLFPLAAAAGGTFIAIPTMRCQELKCGIPVYDQNDFRLGNSVIAAQNSVSNDLYTRAATVAPAMILPPLIVHYYEVQRLLRRSAWIHLPLNFALVGLLLTLSTPTALASMKKTEMYYGDLEPHLRSKVQKRFGLQVPHLVYNEKNDDLKVKLSSY